MRSTRLSLIFLAFYFVLIGGSAYYTLIFPVRVLHHVVVTLLLLVWFWRRWRSGEGLPRTPLDWPLLAAVVVWAVTALTSVDPRMALENLWFVFLHVTLFYMLVDFFQRGRSKIVMEAAFIIGALVVMITGLELASWYLSLGYIPNPSIVRIALGGFVLEVPRVALALNISTLLAGFVAPMSVLALGWALTARRADYRQVLWLLFALLVGVLLLTFSRGGLMSLGAALATFISVEGVRRRVLSPMLVGVGMIAAAGIFTFIFVISPGRTSGDLGRLDMYESAVETFVDYPLTGVGPGLYGRALREYRTPELARDKLASAHNAPLNTLAETGLPGFVVSVWLAGAVVLTWWRVHQRQDTAARKMRHLAAVAAVVGIAAHNMVDVFTVTPVVLVILLAVAYSVVGHRTVLDDRPPGRRWPVVVGGVIAVGFAVFLAQSDRAQAAYRASFNGDFQAAQRAQSLDPGLNLYDLHVAYLTAQAQPPAEAIAAYEAALMLEPTWDLGWANLGATHARAGDYAAAVNALERAYAINPLRSYYLLHAARFAEVGGIYDDAQLAAMYTDAIGTSGTFTLSPFWAQTALRHTVIADFIADDDNAQIARYRAALVHLPEQAADLVPTQPQTAAEYWIAGESARLNGDNEQAYDLFSAAIDRDPTEGDYYVSRARVTPEREAALDDLDKAAQFGARYVPPDAVRALLASNDAEAETYRIATLARNGTAPQEFVAVLYGGRQSVMQLDQTVSGIGRGRAALQAGYDLAAFYVQQGRIEDARRVYNAILSFDPFETDAQEALQSLNG